MSLVVAWSRSKAHTGTVHARVSFDRTWCGRQVARGDARLLFDGLVTCKSCQKALAKP